MIFIGVMLPLALFKISMELKHDKDKGTKLASKTLFRMILIFGVLFAIYFVV